MNILKNCQTSKENLQNKIGEVENIKSQKDSLRLAFKKSEENKAKQKRQGKAHTFKFNIMGKE